MGKRAERSKTTYNNMAAGYDSSPEGNYTRPHKAELVKQVIVRDGDSILDVACGNGALLGELSKKADILAFGVDLSENMIAAAKERHPDCTFVVSLCVPLPFKQEGGYSLKVENNAIMLFTWPVLYNFTDETVQMLFDRKIPLIQVENGWYCVEILGGETLQDSCYEPTFEFVLVKTQTQELENVDIEYSFEISSSEY